MLDDKHAVERLVLPALSLPHNALPLEGSLDGKTNWAYEYQSPLCYRDASRDQRARGGLSSWLAAPHLPRTLKIRTSNPADLETPTVALKVGSRASSLSIP